MIIERPTDGREGYSDRMAYLMACLSDLVYIKFNKPPLQPKIAQIVKEGLEKYPKKPFLLLKFFEAVNYDPEQNRSKLFSELQLLDLRCDNFFDQNDTQAMLVEHKDFLVLVFRGTEKTSYRDIYNDFNIRQIPADGGKTHKGFYSAYEEVHNQIQSTLVKKEFLAKPLYITGHSLGGALATIAARKIKHKGGILACYTFGSPRVGDSNWISSITPPIKVPIYRIVNAIDVVTMLPPDKIIRGVCFLLKFIPYMKKFALWLKQRFGNYMHTGDMRYLTNCPKGDYRSVKLLYSVDIFFRIGGSLKAAGSWGWGKLLADHKINIYKEKLKILAEQRNT